VIIACRAYMNARLKEIVLQTGTTPYSDGTLPPPPEGEEPDPDAVPPARNIFFEDLPLDFLKDNDYAACCLELRDTSFRYGKLIDRKRNAEKTAYTFTRRRFRRELIYRCLLYAKRADDLWGSTGTTGLVEQLLQGIANNKVIAASDNSAIRIEAPDTSRPWDTDVEMERKLRRPRLAIVRVQFTGGIQTAETLPLIPSVEIVPLVG
jgi:hypothetical protein